MNIINFSISKLLVDELPEFINRVVEIVEKHGPTTLGVKSFFDTLVGKQLLMGELKAKRVIHPLTDQIIADRKRRIDFIRAIIYQFRAGLNGKSPGMKEAAQLLQPLIVKHLVTVETSNSKKVSGNVDLFLTALTSDEALTLAVTTVGIETPIGELRVFQNLIKTDETRRSKDYSNSRIVREKKIRMNTTNAFTNLIKAIELAMVQNVTVDYSAVVSELNELLVKYRSSIRSRSTANTNAIKKETVTSSATTTVTAS